MTPAEIKAILQLNHNSTAFFAELVELTPAAGGGPVSLTCHIQEAIEDNEIGGSADEQETGLDLERLEVHVIRDVAVGGWLDFEPGDQLTRAAAVDADRRPFVFEGELVEYRPEAMVAIFHRPRLNVLGAQP